MPAVAERVLSHWRTEIYHSNGKLSTATVNRRPLFEIENEKRKTL
jgi:hypothetical protein